MRKSLIPLLLLSLAACGTVTLNCPSDRTVTATLNGPNVATVAAELAAVIGPMVGLAAQKGPALMAAAPATNDGTLSVKTLDIFGTQSYSCGNLAAITPLKTSMLRSETPPVEPPKSTTPQSGEDSF